MTGNLRGGLRFGGRGIVPAIVVAAGIMLATAAHGAGSFDITIGDFGPDWDVDFIGTAGGGGSAGTVPTGGNPGSFRRVTLNFAGTGLAWHVNIATSATVTPSSIGSISVMH